MDRSYFFSLYVEYYLVVLVILNGHQVPKRPHSWIIEIMFQKMDPILYVPPE